MMLRRLSILGCSILALSGCKDKARPMEMPEFTVEVATPVRGDVAEFRQWVGRLDGMVDAEILPQVTGYVKERLFENGQSVKKGDVLYRLDDVQYREALQRAENTAVEAEANLVKAKKDLDFYEPLVKNGSVSRQSYQDALQAYRAAEASLAAAKSSVALAKTNVDYCVLTAPVDGIAGFAQAEVGDYVAPNSQPMVLVSSFDPIRIYFDISEQDWLNQNGPKGPLGPGAQVSLILSNGSGYPGHATVTGVNNTVSTSTGSLKLEARAANPDALLRPGMYVNVRAKTKEIKDALLVPAESIITIQGQNMVIAVDDKGRPHVVPIVKGLPQGDKVSVTGNIGPDTVIVVTGTQQALMTMEGRGKLKTVPQQPTA